MAHATEIAQAPQPPPPDLRPPPDEILRESPNSQLARAVNTLKDQWGTNRSKLEAKWERNWMSYKGEFCDQWKKDEGKGARSSTHIHVTKSRVMMAYSMLVDLMLQGGNIPVDLKVGKWQGKPVEELPPEVRKELERRAKSCKTYIAGLLAAGKAERALSKNILSGAIFGESYAKITRRRFEESTWETEPLDESDDGNVATIPSNTEVWDKRTSGRVGPAWNYVSVWDIFRDLEEFSPREGRGVIHRQQQSAFWLRSRIGKPFFDDEAIKRALNAHKGQADTDTGTSQLDGEDYSSMSPSLRYITHRVKQLTVNEFWGRQPRVMVEEYERMVKTGDWQPTQSALALEADDGDDVECMVMTADDEVVRFARTSIDERPVFRFAFEEGLDEDEGIGVADNVEDMQKVTNGAFRAIEDNIRQTANAIWALKEAYIKNSAEIKKNGLQPGTVVWLKEGVDDIRQAIQSLPQNDVTQPLIHLLGLCLEMLDNDSMIPRTQLGSGAPGADITAYEASLRQASSTKYIGAVIRRIDEMLIEPIIGYFYDYAMRDPEFPDKGNFIVEATGYQSYHDRLLVFDTSTRILAQFLANPLTAVHTNVRHHMENIIRSQDMDVSQGLVSEEQAMQTMQAMQTDPLKLAMQAEAQAAARLKQAQATKTMDDIKQNTAKTRNETAALAHELRQGANGNGTKSDGGSK